MSLDSVVTQTDANPPAVGDIWDSRYRLDREIGRGGGGIVFAATHLVLGNQVAIKIVPGIAGQRAQRRLVREATALAQLRDLRIVTMRDVGVTREGMYLVMDYLQGRSLYEIVSQNGPLPFGIACWIVREVALAVASLHKFRFIHRDIKPSNIFLAIREGVVIVQLIDLGLVRIASDSQDSALTIPLSLLGTVPYMAPEQIAQPSSVGNGADIWSLGVVLHELCAGKVPFVSTNRQDWLKEITNDSLNFSETLPADVGSLLNSCLALRPEDRINDAMHLARQLEGLCEPNSPELLLQFFGISKDAPTSVSDGAQNTSDGVERTQSEIGETQSEELAAMSSSAELENIRPISKEKLVGQVAGRQYEMGRLLGEGATGAVYAALDDLGFSCAVKMLSGAGPRARKRAMREAMAARSIQSPHVVSVTDVGIRPTGEPFLAMELLEGEDLRITIEKMAPLPQDVVMNILLSILKGLRHIHQARLWHRDIKPSNVLLVRQSDPLTGQESLCVKLCDLGLARAHNDEGATADTTLGTPGYTAPEILRGEQPSEATELFSAFVTAFEALTKRLPWQGQGTLSLKHIAPWVRDEVAQVIDRGVAWDPSMRWQSIDTAIEAVSRCGTADRILPQQLHQNVSLTTQRRKRSPWVYLLVVLAIGPIVWTMSSFRTNSQADVRKEVEVTGILLSSSVEAGERGVSVAAVERPLASESPLLAPSFLVATTASTPSSATTVSRQPALASAATAQRGTLVASGASAPGASAKAPATASAKSGLRLEEWNAK